MMKRKYPLVLLLLVATSLVAHAQVEFRVSVKFILDSNGNLPSGGIITNASSMQEQVNTANAILENYARGIRYRLTEVVNLSGVSSWFNAPARSGANRDALETAATGNKSLYAWRDNAINVYINNTSSAICSLPGDHNIIFIGTSCFPTTFTHEAGHFFNLLHTHEGANECGSPDPLPGNNDQTVDTLPDHECWGRDDISRWSFGTDYNSLSPGSQFQVDNTFLNVMSYHMPRSRFTPDQLDRLTDAANTSRNNVVSGHIIHVDRNNGCFAHNGSRVCSISGGPFTTVSTGISSAKAGDVVLVRAGNYNEVGTFTKAVTLCGTRGAVTIGKP